MSGSTDETLVYKDNPAPRHQMDFKVLEYRLPHCKLDTTIQKLDKLMAMIKDNHLDLAGRDLETLTREVRGRLGSDVPITSEARNEQEARGAIRGGADVVLLDNMSIEEMTRLVPILRAEVGERQVELEASGGMGLADVDAVAATGVDRISVGALTHSAPVLDLSLLVEVPD